MLRLRPSEITLTAADVEETRLRMERRQAPWLPTNLPARARGPLLPLGPRLRRGPERSRDNAIASLGEIPILQPHQVVHASVDDPSGHHPDSAVEGSGSHPQHAAEDWVEGSTSSTAHQPSLLQTISGSRVAQADNDGLIESQADAPADGVAQAADMSSTPRPARTTSILQRAAHAPSPLHQMHTLSSPDQPQSESGNSSKTRSRYLQGYFHSPDRYRFREYHPHTEPRQRGEGQTTYRARTMSSSSEPSYSLQVQRPDRSESSADDVFWNTPAPDPPFPSVAYTPEPLEEDEEHEDEDEDRAIHAREDHPPGASHTHGTPGQDRFPAAFQTSETEEAIISLATMDLNATAHAARRFSSEASTSSYAYSYYELPETRQSSSDQSQGAGLGQAQYDGASSSRQLSQGAYYSIRTSHIRAANEVHLRPPPSPQAPSRSSPDLGQPSISPLPAVPYGRVPRVGHIVIPPIGLIDRNDLLGEDGDPVRAAQRNLSSPLDILEQRATSYFSRIVAEQQAHGIRAHSGTPGLPHTDFDAQPARQRRVTGSEGMRRMSGNSAHSQTSTGYIYDNRRHGQPNRFSEQPHHRNVGPQARRRDPPTTRDGQRSSENAPLDFPQEEHTIRRSQPHNHRATLNHPYRPPPAARLRGGDFLVPAPIPLRFSLPHPAGPRDLSNQALRLSPPQTSLGPHSDPGDELSSSDTPSPRHEPSHGPPQRIPIEGGVSLRAPAIPPRYASRPHPDADILRRPTTRMSQYSPPPGPFTRPGPAPTATTFDIANGITSRGRPPLVRAPTSRRRVLPPEQLNQENSMQAEAQLMREELQNAGMRFGEDAGLEVLDETPPRVGRFERRMME